jgi:spermidine synthase
LEDARKRRIPVGSGGCKNHCLAWEGRIVIPWKLLDTAQIPGGGELRLKQRGTEYVIMLGTIDLMNSRLSGSEEALGTIACERLAGLEKPRILIGGLGMGFTLRAVLAKAAARAEIIVAELVPSVVAWAKGPMAELFGESLQDPRVSIVVEDVGHSIRSAPKGFDAILLDVDNGPEGLTRLGNDALYEKPGLNAAHIALRPGGILAVWSSSGDKSFTKRLRTAGFVVDEVRVRAHRGQSGARHTIWFAARQG